MFVEDTKPFLGPRIFRYSSRKLSKNQVKVINGLYLAYCHLTQKNEKIFTNREELIVRASKNTFRHEFLLAIYYSYVHTSQ